MTEYDNTNRGALFKNDKQGNENWADYQGSLNVDGVEHYISAWIKKSKKGQTFMSLSVKRKDSQRSPNPQKQSDGTPFSDEIPF